MRVIFITNVQNRNNQAQYNLGAYKEDRPLVERNKIPQQGVDISDTIFSDQNIYKVDRRILNLTKVKGPTKITYETESQKTNSLYTVNNDNQGGLLND